MSNYRPSLIAERAIERDSLDKLNDFISEPFFPGLPKLNKDILIVQKITMENKVNILTERVYINDHRDPENQVMFSLGTAVELSKRGYKVARLGWNGSGMFVYYVPAGTYKTMTEVAKKEFGDKVSYKDYLALKTADGSVATWAPSSSDTLATDWVIVE